MSRAIDRLELSLAEVVLRAAIGALTVWRRLGGR
jgi:hypothetical protein